MVCLLFCCCDVLVVVICCYVFVVWSFFELFSLLVFLFACSAVAFCLSVFLLGVLFCCVFCCCAFFAPLRMLP